MEKPPHPAGTKPVADKNGYKEEGIATADWNVSMLLPGSKEDAGVAREIRRVMDAD